MIDFDEKEERVKILREAALYRSKEVLLHQINIDNFTRAISKIQAIQPDSRHMHDFKNELEGRLKDEIAARDKESIILDVVLDQLREVEQK